MSDFLLIVQSLALLVTAGSVLFSLRTISRSLASIERRVTKMVILAGNTDGGQNNGMDWTFWSPGTIPPEGVK